MQEEGNWFETPGLEERHRGRATYKPWSTEEGTQAWQK